MRLQVVSSALFSAKLGSYSYVFISRSALCHGEVVYGSFCTLILDNRYAVLQVRLSATRDDRSDAGFNLKDSSIVDGGRRRFLLRNAAIVQKSRAF